MSRALRMWFTLLAVLPTLVSDRAADSLYRAFMVGHWLVWKVGRALGYFTEHEDSFQFWTEFFIEL